MLYGYARVSTLDQETALQLDALRRAGAQEIFSEKVSAVKARPQLEAVLRRVGPGDVLLVYKLDRLARSLKHLLAIVDRLEEAGCALRSLTEAIDTHSLAGRMMTQMLGAVAEFERGLILERSRAGVKAALARGVKLGRPRKYDPAVEALALAAILSGEVSYTEAARRFGIPRTQVQVVMRRHRLATTGRQTVSHAKP